MVQRIKRKYTPWEYLYTLVNSDRGQEHDEHWMTRRLQEQYPGKYRVEVCKVYNKPMMEYRIVFENPGDETLFRLKWS